MADLELYAVVRDFIERGGDVLLVIAAVTAAMWTLIYERFWYFRIGHREQRKRRGQKCRQARGRRRSK